MICYIKKKMDSNDLIAEMLDDVKYGSVKRRIWISIMMKEIKDLEKQIDELNDLRAKLLRNVNEEKTVQEIKLIITTEIRKLINKTVYKREMCIDELDDYETTSDEDE